MGRLYKSDTKGVYLDIEEINDHHLGQIVKNLYSRWQLLCDTLKNHRDSLTFSSLYKVVDNNSKLWYDTLEEVESIGPAFLTTNLENSSWATYDDLVNEVKRRSGLKDKEISAILEQADVESNG